MVMMNLAIGLTGLNLVVLLLLARVYFKNYQQMRAEFSLGILLFSIIFIIQKIVTLYILLFTMIDVANAIGTSMFILEVLQSIAFSILFVITMR